MNPKPFVPVTLRDILKAKQIEEQSIGILLGITKSGVSRKMNGNRPWTLEEMDKLSRWLQVPAEDLFPEMFER